MPAEEYNNGLWKWGETGECKYESQEEAEDDNIEYEEEQNNKIMKKESKIKEIDGDKRHIISIEEDDTTVTIVYEKDIHDEEEEEIIDEEEAIEEEVEEVEEEEEEEENNFRAWDKKYNNTVMEKRVFNIENKFETRENGKQVVTGYGSIFASRSENLGGFYEYISPTAISQETIEKSDTRALINHDQNLILARQSAGNLKLSVDKKGLRYEFEIPEGLSYGKDLAINMKNGNINQSSFAFTVSDDEWDTDDNGNDIRTITGIDQLFDVSPVTYPAYKQAGSDLVVAQRGLAMYKEKQEIKEEENDLVARSLATLKIELIKRKK